MNYNKFQEEFEVEKISDKRIVDSMIEYFIKWKDHPAEENSWLPLDNLYNSMDLVLEFEETQPAREPTTHVSKIVKIIKRSSEQGICKYLVLHDDNRFGWFIGTEHNYLNLSESEKELFAKFLSRLSVQYVQLDKLQHLYYSISLN